MADHAVAHVAHCGFVWLALAGLEDLAPFSMVRREQDAGSDQRIG
jgi:hypothetical protein